MSTWYGKRPLESDAGRALAAEVLDNPGHALTLVTGALEGMTGHEGASPATPEADAALRAVYLRGLAAAALVADAACGEQRFTSALDYAVGGDAVRFLRTEQVTLGLIMAAASAMTGARWMVRALADSPYGAPVPPGHGLVVEMVSQMLTQAARVRLARARGHDG